VALATQTMEVRKLGEPESAQGEEVYTHPPGEAPWSLPVDCDWTRPARHREGKLQATCSQVTPGSSALITFASKSLAS
jgi:hypothetical protein